MINPQDLCLIGLKAEHAPLRDGDDVEEPPCMTYEIARQDDVWCIHFHDCAAGRFESFEAALSFARGLARECAALGKTACVALQKNAPPSMCEIYPAHAV
jgi:hypothetical protein